jgi:O-antigen ligase
MTDKAHDIIAKARAATVIAYAACLPVSISGAQICLGLLLVSALYRVFVEKRWRMRYTDLALAAFIVWSIIAALFSDYRFHSLSKIPRLWVHLAWFGLLAANVSKTTWKKALYALVISAALMGLYGAAQHYFGSAVPRFLVPDVDLWQPTGEYFHAVGFFDHHLTFGNTMILCLICGIGLFMVEKGRRSILAILAALIFVGVVFSYARSAWLALAFMAALLAFIKGRRVVIATAVAAAVLIPLIVTVSPTVRDRLATTFMVKKNLERIYLWKTSIDMAVDHPVTGIGPGVYRKYVREYRRDYNIKWTTESHAHNSYIMAAAQCGFAGALLLLLLLAAVFHDPVKFMLGSDIACDNFDLSAALTTAMAGFAFACLFQHNFGDAEVVMTFWFVAAAANVFCDRDE